MKKRAFLFLSIIPLLSSCSFNTQTKQKHYLNYKYSLVRAGDIHGKSPAYGEVLDRISGYTSYISLFDKTKSYINYQCYGSSFNDFYCDTTFVLYDKKGNKVFGDEDYHFRTSFSGGQNGKIIFENSEDSAKFGKIYVYTPYWCRWQFNYDVKGDGNLVKLTFEFWKTQYNELPDWSLK